VKDTDDDTEVDGSDAGAVPATSTKYKGQGLVGQNVHGVKAPAWYYTPEEWSRSIGWGKVPDERNTFLKLELERLEKEIQHFSPTIKHHTKQWKRIQELKKIMGVK